MLIVLLMIMAVLARASGGGIWSLPNSLSRLPEIAFSAVFGLAVFSLFGGAAGLIAWIWSYAWMETGHGTAFHMGDRPQDAQGGRKQFLSPVVDAACEARGWPLGGWQYCWLFMGLKGALIGLPVAPAGLLLAFLWPASYWIGRKFKSGALCEFLSGACAGFVIWVYLT